MWFSLLSSCRLCPRSTLPKDPQPSVDRINELARRILSGEILLPKFQRNFAWGKKQILRLLDSVNRGYPIGSGRERSGRGIA
jgi:hypothetical protein